MIFINLYVLGATLYSDSTLLITDFSITPPTIFIDIFVDEVERNNVKVLMGYIFRHSPLSKKVKLANAAV